MEELTKIFYLASMFSPLFVLIAAAIVYWRYRIAQRTNQRRSAVLFVVGVVLVGVLVGWLGVAAGIAIFCSAGAGAQCGFAGVFFTGPLAFSVAVAIYLWIWVRRGNRSASMSKLYFWSRLLAGFFGFTTLLGIIWFSDSLGRAVIIAGLLMGFSSIAAALVPARALSNKAVRPLVTILCVVGIGAGLVLVANDVRGPLSKIEWDVLAIRFLHIGSLAVLAAKALQLLSGPAK